MPDVVYTMLEEGDAITATSVNSRFTGVVDAVNDLTVDAPDQFCFNNYQLPSLVVIKDQQWIAGPITYRESVIGKGSGNAVVIDSNGDTGGGTALSITFTAQSLGAGMRGIFVAFDAVVNSIKDGASADNRQDRYVMLRLQYEDTSAGWTTINKTHRMCGERGLSSAGQTQELDCSIRTLIVAGDVTNNISGVRAQLYLIEDTAHAADTTAVLSSVQLMVLGVHSN